MDIFRKLLVLGLSEAVRKGPLHLQMPNCGVPNGDPQIVNVDILGKPSLFIWNEIDALEVRIAVWWDYDHFSNPVSNQEPFFGAGPLAHKRQYPNFVGATASGWLERKAGLYIQGFGRDGIIHTYLRRDMREMLVEMPDPQPLGFQPEGRFYF